MPTIRAKTDAAKTAGDSLLSAAAIATIAALLSGKTVEGYDFDPLTEAVFEDVPFGKTLTDDDAALIGSAVDRIRKRVTREATRPDGVPEAHVIRTGKTVSGDTVTVGFYWGDPPKRRTVVAVPPQAGEDADGDDGGNVTS